MVSVDVLNILLFVGFLFCFFVFLCCLHIIFIYCNKMTRREFIFKSVYFFMKSFVSLVQCLTQINPCMALLFIDRHLN